MQGAHFKEDWTRMRAQEQQLRDDVVRGLGDTEAQLILHMRAIVVHLIWRCSPCL